MSLDLWVGLAVLAGLLVAEGALPYYEARDLRYVHGTRNLSTPTARFCTGMSCEPASRTLRSPCRRS